MGELLKQDAKQRIRDGMQFQKDLEIAKSDQSTEEMHLAQREAIQQRGDDSVPLKVPEKQKMEEVLSAQAKINQREINKKREFAPKGMRNIAKVGTDEPVEKQGPEASAEEVKMKERTDEEEKRKMEFEAEPVVPKPEDIQQAELNQTINDFEAKQSQIAEMRAKKTGRFASLGKALGIKPRNLDDDPEVMGLEKESHDLYRNLLSRGIHLYKGDKAQLENFLKQFDEFEVFRATYNQEMDERAKACKWPETVLAGFQKIGQKWSEMNWKQKLLIGGAASGLMTVGAIGLGAGAGIFGAASLMTGWRWAYRGFGAMAAGVGRKVQLDVKLMKEIEANQDMRFKQKMDFLKQYENDLDQGIKEIILDGAGVKYARKEYEQRSLENTILARNLALKAFVISSIIGESFRLGSQATGINLGTILKKIGGYVGFGGSSSIVPEVSRGPSSEAFYTHGSDGKITGLTPQGNEHFKQFNIEPLDSLKPEVKAGGSLQEWAKTTPAAGVEVHTPEIAKPKFEDIASVKIRAGGSMWGSIENNIKANPSAYGLDQTDPNFKTNMNGKISEMLHDFADKKGLSYKQLDKVFEGDNFKIKHDIAGNPYLDDFHGKAFGPDVSRGGAGAAQEIAPSKAGMTVEDVKPKASVVAPEDMRPRTGAAEHQPGGTRGKVMQYDSDTPAQKIAKENFAKASQHYENVQEYKAKVGPQIDNMSRIAEIRQAIATKPGLIRILNGASFGERADVWNKSAIGLYNQIMSHGGYIAHDVISADAVKDLNENNIRLMAMFLKFGKPQPGELFENYYQRIFTNSGNIPVLNTFISGDIEKLIGHPIK